MSAEASGELFREEQRFTQVWIWLIVLGLAGPAWWALIAQVLLDEAFGDEPAADWVLWLIWLAFGIGLPLLLARLKLTVTVSFQGVGIRFRPFVRRSIPITDIRHNEAQTYRPIREYSGWGIRGWGAKRAYNVRGNQGVQLVLANGDRIMIGSQRAEELARAIELAKTSPGIGKD